jgi:5-methylcytosine-specific restriction protein A
MASDQSRAGPAWRGWYKTARWAALRLRIFLRDLYQCQQPGCGKVEGNTSLLVCDHVIPHRGDTRLFWDEHNLQTLCKRCHDVDKQRAEQATLHQRGVWH